MRISVLCALGLSLLMIAGTWYVFGDLWYVLRGDFMSVRKVCQRWGNQPLDITAFKSAEDDELLRARMACSLIRNQNDYIGMDRSELLTRFGPFTGYHYTETTPTYLIEVAKTRAEDSWQIVFLLDRDRQVREIAVHKN